MTIKRSIFRVFQVVFSFAVVIFAISAKAEVYCEISIDSPMPVCPGTYFELSVFEGPNQVFDWQRQEGSGFVTVGNESILGLQLQDSTTFRVIVIDTITNDTCPSELFGVGVRPLIQIEFFQHQLTCTNGDTTNGRNAKVGATASGAFQPDEYHYFWDVLPLQLAPGDSSLAIGLKAHQNYAIMVKDSYGCATRDTFYTRAYPNPVIEIYTEPGDTVYLQNPLVTYSFDNLSVDSIPLTTHSWEIMEGDTVFSSELDEPTYKYNSVGEFYTFLKVVNPQGCDTTYTTQVTVKPVELFIPNVFSPGNGDGSNDKFEITTADNKGKVTDETLGRYYEQSRLVIFNRLGRKVFESNNYQNDWEGDNLPDGVYYYVLECHGAKSTDIFKGSVTIIRSN
ncbi:MAG: hypothetical protein CVT99_05220 [Bacteroidetes bacterium HGW-Bacteroidetes-16]|jgi:gliding motility-associated-like protein|nr:MAG: hypothetical protein CVT99_05220 [Bacteroidetes bacterium HGW-Bacteroidetes-16]